MRRFREREARGFTTARIIGLGFLGAIFAGTILLLLPIATVQGKETGFLDALFTSTTSVCVTGLVTVPTFSHWTIFGQFVIMLLTQIGGLGVITFTMLFLLALHKRIGLKERILIQDAYNLDTLHGLVKMIVRIVKGTLIVEGVGALFYMAVFIPEFGLIGIWKSIFNSVSAFCNAGMDVLGANSLESYVENPVINITTMTLIILGGIGFPVWWNVVDMFRNWKADYASRRAAIRHFRLHTKLVLCMTAGLILVGAVLIFLLEFNNPETLGNLTLPGKIQASLFQSVTTRTAGFVTISQAGLHKGTALICCVLMFIGGSPSGTAGGIKTTTTAILVMTVHSIIRGRRDTEMFGRKVNDNIVRRALSIFMVSLVAMLISIIVLSIVQPGSFLDCVYESISAIATVGLTRDFTAALNVAGRLTIIAAMYIGRIGPISLALFFNTRHFVNLRTYPEEKVSVG